MFTDIVGYTTLMGENEEKALKLVRQCKAIQQPLVEKHNGQWLKEMGDGVMAQFGSALDAVNCALEIQRTSRADFDGDIRIGIHLGDITIENNDIYGDGVNVASRLESIADPGGIYISESIEKAIQGQTEIQAKYLGEMKLEKRRVRRENLCHSRGRPSNTSSRSRKAIVRPLLGRASATRGHSGGGHLFSAFAACNSVAPLCRFDKLTFQSGL